jgi:glycosyltransferase involved in cell wall biosynthesis
MGLRLVIFSKITESHGSGGLQRHLSWAVRWLADAGADITVVTTRGGTLPAYGGANRTVELPGTKPGRYNREWWRATRRFIRENGQWDAILSEDGGAWGVVEELRRDPGRPPIGMFRHGTTLASLAHSFPPRRVRALGSTVLSFRDYMRHPRRLARHVDLMMAITEPVAASARREGAGPETDVRVIPLGVNLARYQPPDDQHIVRRALRLDPALPVLTWLGRDVPGKRADVALGVFDRMRARSIPCQMVLVVAQPQPATLARVAKLRKRHGGHVHTFVDAPEEQVRLVHRAGSLQLFPSVLAEGLPIVIMESLACGTPVLARPGSAFRGIDVFLERPDWIVPSDDYDDWVRSADRMLAPEGVEQQRRAARAIAEQYYDLDKTAQRTVAAIQELVERWRHRGS